MPTPTTTPVSFLFATPPPDWCPATFKQAFDDVVNRYWLTGTVSGASNIVVGPNTPSASDQGKLWMKTDAYNNPAGQFIFSSGFWIWPHPVSPDDGEPRMWKKSKDLIYSRDGGDGTDPTSKGNTPTAVTGSFWDIDHDFDFRFPVGVGTNGVPYNGATVGTTLSLGSPGGEEQHLLTKDEMWHQHGIGKVDPSYATDETAMYAFSGGSLSSAAGSRFVFGGQRPVVATANVAGEGGTMFQTDITKDADGGSGYKNPKYPTLDTCSYHNNMPPYMPVYFLKRTSRLYLRGN